MEPANQAEWEVIENSCGFVSVMGNPYAASEFFYTLDGRVAADDPLQIISISGVQTINFKDQAAATVLAGPVSGADDYPTFRALELTDLPAGVGTVTSVAATQPAAGFTISGSPITSSGTLVFALSDDLAALEAMAGIGIVARTAANTYAQRTISAGTGISVSNGDGVSGNPTITNSSPDQTVVLTPGTGIGVTGTYPNFTITNSAPDQTVALTAGPNITITGTYPNFTIEATGGGGSAYNKIRDNSVLETQRESMNFLNTATVSWGITDDAGDAETEITASVIDGSISTVKLADGAVTTVKILNANVTTAKIADSNVTTAKIADDAVTLAKLQNSVGASILLGNNGPAGDAYEELTVAQVKTMLGFVDGNGNGVANRLAYWTGTGTISSDAAFTIDAVNDRMTITGTVAGLGANNAFLNLNSGALAGSTEFLRASGNITNSLIAGLYNANNVAGTSSSLFVLSVGGANGGDPVIQFNVNAVVTHSIGIDNSDADKFKITPNSATPGGVANSGLIITNAAAALVGINKDAPAHPLDVSGRARSTEFINDSAAGQKPTVDTLGGGLGAGAAINDVSGSNNGFSITFTTGAAPGAGGEMFKVTFATSYPALSFPVFCQGNDNAANELSKFSWSARTGASFNMKVRAGQTLTASTQYILIFTCFGI